MFATLWLGMKVVVSFLALIMSAGFIMSYFYNELWFDAISPWTDFAFLVLSLLIWSYFIGWFILL